MRTVCIYRRGAAQHWRGKDVRWIVCAECRREMISDHITHIDKFIAEEVERMTNDMAGASPVPHPAEEKLIRKLHTPKESDAPNRPHKIVEESCCSPSVR